jgi:hypothetical protein
MRAAFVVGLLVCVGGAVARPAWHQLSTEYSFEQYMADFGKSYGCPKERAAREAEFTHNLMAVLKHNADPTKTWKASRPRCCTWCCWSECVCVCVVVRGMVVKVAWCPR